MSNYKTGRIVVERGGSCALLKKYLLGGREGLLRIRGKTEEEPGRNSDSRGGISSLDLKRLDRKE